MFKSKETSKNVLTNKIVNMHCDRCGTRHNCVNCTINKEVKEMLQKYIIWGNK